LNITFARHVTSLRFSTFDDCFGV